MAKNSIVLTDFSGGISPEQKSGIKGSCRFSKGLNIHEDRNYVTIHPKPTKVSGTTVTDLVVWAEDGTPFDTNRYFYSQGGKIYQETSGGTWSSLRTVSNSSGNGFLVFDDFLYYSLDAELGRYGKLSGTPAFNDAFLSDGVTDLDQSGGGTGATDYVPPTSISEGATARQTFTPTRDPLKAVIIDVDVVGTGDWTVTVHDSADTSIGSKTIANGSMATGDVTFTFATPLRMIIGNEYHFHVTSTVADGGVDTSINTDLEAAEFSTLYGILISDTNWHPMIEHQNGVVIGNERYLAFWDQATYNPNKIMLAPGFNVRSITKIKEFVVADCWRGTDIQGVEDGRRYYWDGIETTYNFYEDLTLGQPNVVHNSKNRPLSILGQRGGLYLGTEPYQFIQEAPKLARGKKVEIYPGAITEWLGLTYFGLASSTDDGSALEQGVYQFGSLKEGTPEVLNYAFPISTGTTQSTTVQIGCVKAFGKDLYLGWRDNTTYGVDKVIVTDNPLTAASWESLIFDNGVPQHQKLALKLVITFEGLASGETVTPKYKIDRASSFTTGTTVSAADSVRAEQVITKRFYEIELGFDLVSSTTFPVITGVYFEFDDLREERGEK